MFAQHYLPIFCLSFSLVIAATSLGHPTFVPSVNGRAADVSIVTRNELVQISQGLLRNPKIRLQPPLPPEPRTALWKSETPV